MGATKHIKIALIDKDKSIKDLHEMSGSSSPLQSLYNQFNRDTWKYSDVERLADFLGCDVVLRDRVTGKTY
jgi:hypothetical protein